MDQPIAYEVTIAEGKTRLWYRKESAPWRTADISKKPLKEAEKEHKFYNPNYRRKLGE